MKIIEFGNIIEAIKNKDNSYINIDGLYTNNIEIKADIEAKNCEYPLAFIIASVISNNYKIFDLLSYKNLDERSVNEIEALKLFLNSSLSGKIVCESIRKDLIQFEIKADSVNYQVEIHLGNHNYCVCEDFNIIAIDALK